MIKILIASLVFGLLFVSVEVLSKKYTLHKEVSRKIVHIVAGVMAAFLTYVMSFREITVLGILFLFVMLVSKKFLIFSSIHDVKRHTYGEVYFPLTVALTALLFPAKELYIFGVLVMALSDGLASVIGQKFGHKKIQIVPTQKTYVGSGTFLIVTIIICLVALLLQAANPFAAVLISVLIGTGLATTELALTHGLDNLLLPPLAALLFWVAERALSLT